MKKIIITGGVGFVGFHLAEELLDRGWKVVALDNMSGYYDPRIKEKRLEILRQRRNFSFYKIDIVDFIALEKIVRKEKPDEIAHLAAQAGVRYSLTDPWAYVRTNEIGTLNIFEIAKRLKLPRVVYASSSSIYGKNTKVPMSEHDRTDTPLSIYAVTKKTNEYLAHSYHHLYGMEFIGLRFFSLYGIWGRPDLALFKFTKNILAGKPITVFNRGRMKRSFTHIADVVSSLATLLEEKAKERYEIYNFGGAEAVELSEFIGKIEKEVGKKAKRMYAPMHMADITDSVADWSKAHKAFGFVPRVSLDKGLAEFVSWFKENESFLKKLRAPK